MKHTLILAIALAASTTVSAEARPGKDLHDKSCLKCHDSGVYTRENRFIKDHKALTKQVNRCQLNVGAEWFDDEVNAVVDFLDKSYYKFK